MHVFRAIRRRYGEGGESSATNVHSSTDNNHVQVRRQFVSATHLLPDLPGKKTSRNGGCSITSFADPIYRCSRRISFKAW